MKKLLIVLLCCSFVFLAAACNSKEVTYDYGFDQMKEVFWESDIVYNESVVMLKDETGTSGSLMFTPKKIVSVRDYSLEVEYKEGVDWEFRDGKLWMLEGSSMAYLLRSQLVVQDKADLPEQIANPRPTKDGTGWILFSESAFITMHQIFVTYTYDNAEWKGPRPTYQGDKLPKTMEKLSTGGEFNLLFYGDSIFVGASATAQLNCPPFMPRIGDLTKEYFSRDYGCTVNYKNTSKGGQTSRWGIQNVQELAVANNPDLMFIGFGMNDGSTMQNISVAEYKQNIQGIINAVRAKNADCEFVLVGGMLPNPLDVANGIQRDYVPALEQLAEENSNTVTITMAAIHEEMLKIKNFIDMSGNNVNHPNDFLIRTYLMNITTIFEKD